jgi:hypothetical protein
MKFWKKITIALMSVLISTLFTPIKAQDIHKYQEQISLVPSLLKTSFAIPDSNKAFMRLIEKSATCFPLVIGANGKSIFWGFISNCHPFVFSDSLTKTLVEVDSGVVLRNASDTVLAIDVRVINKNPSLDLALMEPINQMPTGMGLQSTGIKFDLLIQTPSPVVGEKIFYCGFPLLIGQDTTFKNNCPVVVNGYISQIIPGRADFIVQAPIFSGASGSPLFSEESGQFIGVVFGKVPGQESFLYAIKIDSIQHWLQTVTLEKLKK